MNYTALRKLGTTITICGALSLLGGMYKTSKDFKSGEKSNWPPYAMGGGTSALVSGLLLWKRGSDREIDEKYN